MRKTVVVVQGHGDESSPCVLNHSPLLIILRTRMAKLREEIEVYILRRLRSYYILDQRDQGFVFRPATSLLLLISIG